jgi:hypothetical protein
MYEILFIVGVFLVGFWIGEIFTICKCLDIYKILTGKEFDPRELADERINESLENETDIAYETELVNSVIYLYTPGKNQFICQANSIDELCRKYVEYTKKNQLGFKHNNEFYYYNGNVLEKINNEN